MFIGFRVCFSNIYITGFSFRLECVFISRPTGQQCEGSPLFGFSGLPPHKKHKSCTEQWSVARGGGGGGGGGGGVWDERERRMS